MKSMRMIAERNAIALRPQINIDPTIVFHAHAHELMRRDAPEQRPV
ncbi:hypothetical protein HY285_01125 [Candidatus Peregrinibacteria bacterium]|nr:hypothetical protein [Candidatus Peregrinibacteria bacterium]